MTDRMVRRRFTILGCGSSPGTPRIDGDWGACDPSEPKNRRTRASFLIEQIAEDGGRTTVVIDTGPDFRAQMIAAEVRALDAVIYTHPHADHIHGIDDLRIFALSARRRMPIHADAFTLRRIHEGFAYCIETPEGSDYPPIVMPVLIEDDDRPIVISGAGGDIEFRPLRQIHGSIQSLGFRIGDVAYCCDISDFPDETVSKLQNLDVLIIDALQYREHPSHLSLTQAMSWIERLKPRQTYLTHMHIPMDYATVDRETPDNVTPAFDLLRFERDFSLEEWNR
ncbi:MBL fold metallo-hydrolase [Rhizobium sp. EC-SD404]|uniref:MBL fold metallo-hydrolase n=1 Tax=Rhizobium sp. EC-SD404 TaxID=2038389 RepID=UPI001258E971|nr:MBL fold metallo-hydrolase [Rhizobium sp. EC-SD404]VVT19391.1 Phosphoribosyl 1,2-cyclic phosphodiesterase [Rhizobium sp. EC-SD404]